MQAEPEIDCIDCGGRCYLLSRPDEDGKFWPGDIVTYRCADCRDRWDLVLPSDDEVALPAGFAGFEQAGPLGGVEGHLP